MSRIGFSRVVKTKMSNYLWITFLGFIISTCFPTHAQNKAVFSSIQYITANEGLSQSEVTAIIKDRKGFVWIGTRGGLNRYDGTNIKVYQNEIGNPNSLINNSIEALFEDSSGSIWIGTKSNGISRFLPDVGRFENIRSFINDSHIDPDFRVVSIAEDANKLIWIGTWGKGLYIYNPSNGRLKQVLNQFVVNDIYKSTNGNMFAATSFGIFVFDTNGVQLQHLQLGDMTSIWEEKRSGKFYFGSWGLGLTSYDPKTEIIERFQIDESDPKSLTSNNAYALFGGENDVLWIGTWGGGLNRFNLKSKTFAAYDLASNNEFGGVELYQDVISIYKDELGVLWFGTNGGGIAKVDKRSGQFGYVKGSDSNKGLPNEPIWAALKDSRDNFWIGIKGNKNLFYSNNNESFKKVLIPNDFPRFVKNRKRGVRAIYEDLDSNMWIGDNNGLYKINLSGASPKLLPVQIRTVKNSPASILNKVTVLFQSSDSIFWIGTQQRGLYKSTAKGNPSNQSFKVVLERQRITAIVEDKTKNLWIGTYNGLVEYIKETGELVYYAKQYGENGGLSSNIIISLHKDKNDNLWIGTPNGLNLANRNNDGSLVFRTYQEKDGLPNNYIHSILEDELGDLWVSTNKGISHFNIEKGSFYNYDVNDGLQSNSFMENVAFKDRLGKLHFGGIYGLNSFYPNTIENSAIPKVIINEFRINGQEITPNEELNGRRILEKSIEFSESVILKNSENIFSISYTALDFHSSSRYAYTFMMEGLDDEWRATTSEKSVTYSNLDPGDYKFKVKAAFGEDKNEASITTLKIKVLPPFWRTWPALVLYVFVFAGLLLLYRYVINQQHELKHKLNAARLNRKKNEELAEMKTRFFTNVAHEIRTPLSLISGPVETLIEDTLTNEQRNSYLSTIHYHTKRLNHLVGQLLDFRKAESGKMTLQVAQGNFAKFVNEIFLSFRDLADSKGIVFNMDIVSNEVPLVYDRSKMEIVLFNLLSNAFKYTNDWVKLNVSVYTLPSLSKAQKRKFPNGYCRIEVEDNGQGMNKEVMDRVFDRFYQLANIESMNIIGTGIGLALVKNIVELHCGEIRVSSKPDKGSVFTIDIPLGDSHFTTEQFISNFKKAEDPIHYQISEVLIQNKELIDSNGYSKKDAPKILIVEDNPEIRHFLRAVFSDFNILEAINGEEGLKILNNEQPDIIISDLMMPEMDGLSFCKAIRSNEATLHIPIIMLTARTAALFEEKGYDSGVDIYVTKPFSPKVLRSQVERLLDGHKKLRDYFSKKITLSKIDKQAPSMDQKFLNEVMDLVENNLSNDKLNRDFIASKMAVSPSTLYRKIKSLTGLDITVFIRSIRLKKAAQMIIDKEDTISGIAYSVGFNDPKYFRKCFVKQFGVNPSQFIKTHNYVD